MSCPKELSNKSVFSVYGKMVDCASDRGNPSGADKIVSRHSAV